MSYEVERLVEEADAQLICAICHCLLEDPVVIKCQHSFCDYCIRTWIKARKNDPNEEIDDQDEENTENTGDEENTENNTASCPSCRQRFNEDDDISAAPTSLTDTILKLEIKCAFIGNGCDIITTIKEIKEHEKECGFLSVKCRFVTCSAMMLRKDREGHEETCLHRSVKCPRDCRLEIPYKELDSHSCIEKLRNLNEGYKMTSRFILDLHTSLIKRMAKHCPCLEWAGLQFTEFMSKTEGDIETLAALYHPALKDIQMQLLKNVAAGLDVKVPDHSDSVRMLRQSLNPSLSGGN